MKRLVNVALAIALMVGLYGHYSIGYAQDENGSGQEQTENSGGEGSGESTTEAPPTEEQAPSSGEQPANSEEQPANSEEQPPAENKVYSCSKCGYSSDGPGDCPACNVALTEGASAGENTESDYTSETGGDSSAPTGDDYSSDSETSTPPSDSSEE